MKLKIKRIFAAVIDFYIIGLALALPLEIINYLIGIDIISIIIGIAFVLLFIYLYCRKDCIFGYESIGKKLLGLNIYSKNIRITDKVLLKNRVISTFELLPLYPIDILIDNVSIGDKKYDTEINIK